MEFCRVKRDEEFQTSGQDVPRNYQSAMGVVLIKGIKVIKNGSLKHQKYVQVALQQPTLHKRRRGGFELVTSA
jgi:hypothetical protein